MKYPLSSFRQFIKKFEEFLQFTLQIRNKHQNSKKLMHKDPIPASSKMALSLETSRMAIHVWRSLPPCSGRPVNGSGFGNSIKWIISDPTHNHAPLYGNLSFGLARLTSRPFHINKAYY